MGATWRQKAIETMYDMRDKESEVQRMATELATQLANKFVHTTLGANADTKCREVWCCDKWRREDWMAACVASSAIAAVGASIGAIVAETHKARSTKTEKDSTQARPGKNNDEQDQGEEHTADAETQPSEQKDTRRMENMLKIVGAVREASSADPRKRLSQEGIAMALGIQPEEMQAWARVMDQMEQKAEHHKQSSPAKKTQ